MRQGFAVVVMFCVTASASAQDAVPPGEVARLSRGAAKVIVGRVIDVQARFESNRFGDQLIVSHAVMDVSETLKGAPQTIVNVAVEGGTVGDLTLEVSDMPVMEVGDEAVMFLDTPAQGDATPHDRGRGVMKLDGRRRVLGGGPSLDDVRNQVRSALAAGVR